MGYDESAPAIECSPVQGTNANMLFGPQEWSLFRDATAALRPETGPGTLAVVEEAEFFLHFLRKRGDL